MRPCKRSKNGTVTLAPGALPAGIYATSEGLVIDDVLSQVARTRREFSLPLPSFSLKDIDSYSGAKPAIANLVRATVSLHGIIVFSEVHSLLDEVGEGLYGEPLDTEFAQRYRISAERVEPVLRRIFELGLQTIVTLPARYPRKNATLPRQSWH